MLTIKNKAETSLYVFSVLQFSCCCVQYRLIAQANIILEEITWDTWPIYRLHYASTH